ncbi:MAG: hypothetical protein IK055_01250 [Lachnospiraceae bacterium]|nr:hypothetical protein [Lachnospiraceae bacterium]
MKCSDDIRLAYREFSYGKRECVLSVLIHALLIAGVLFSVTMFLHVAGIGDGFFGSRMEGKYSFQLFGFAKADEGWLKERGITVSDYDDEGRPAYGELGSLRRIWLTKFEATVRGKDIWNAQLDDALAVLLFLHLLFAATAVILWIVWVNTLFNSWSMKTEERKVCIGMYYRLGMPKGSIASVYTLYFAVRACLAFGLAVGINALLIAVVKRFMSRTMKVSYPLPCASGAVIAAAAVLTVAFLLAGYLKMRRNRRVFEG